MKKYAVYVVFKDGRDMQFDTDTNMLHLKQIRVNGARMLITPEQYGVNLNHVKKLEVVQVGHGKIGEIVNRK